MFFREKSRLCNDNQRVEDFDANLSITSQELILRISERHQPQSRWITRRAIPSMKSHTPGTRAEIQRHPRWPLAGRGDRLPVPRRLGCTCSRARDTTGQTLRVYRSSVGTVRSGCLALGLVQASMQACAPDTEDSVRDFTGSAPHICPRRDLLACGLFSGNTGPHPRKTHKHSAQQGGMLFLRRRHGCSRNWRRLFTALGPISVRRSLLALSNAVQTHARSEHRPRHPRHASATGSHQRWKTMACTLTVVACWQ